MRNEEQQKLFALEYIKDFNATQAAKRAGYSDKTAGSQGHDLLKKPEIQAMVSKHIEARANRTNITVDRVVEELAFLAFGKTTDAVYVEDGQVKVRDTKELKESVKSAIAAIKETRNKEGGSVEIKFHNKEKALELLGKHLEMFTDKLHVDGKITLLDVLNHGSEEDEGGKEKA